MKHNYKFKIGEKELPPEQIDKHKDFNRVLHHYRNLTAPYYRKPIYKNPKAFAGLVMILSSAALVYLTTQEENKTKPVAETLKPLTVDSTQITDSQQADVFTWSDLTAGEKRTIQLSSAAVLNVTSPDAIQFGYRELTLQDLAAANIPAPEFEALELLQVDDAIFSAAGSKVEWGKMFSPGEVNKQLLYKLDGATGKWVLVRDGITWYEIKEQTTRLTDDYTDGFTVVEFDSATGQMKPVKSHSTDKRKVMSIIRNVRIREAGTYAIGKGELK